MFNQNVCNPQFDTVIDVLPEAMRDDFMVPLPARYRYADTANRVFSARIYPDGDWREVATSERPPADMEYILPIAKFVVARADLMPQDGHVGFVATHGDGGWVGGDGSPWHKDQEGAGRVVVSNCLGTAHRRRRFPPRHELTPDFGLLFIGPETWHKARREVGIPRVRWQLTRYPD